MEKPPNPKSSIGSLGIYIIKRDFLIELLEESAAKGLTEFVQDIIVRRTDTLKIYSYMFNGYWRPLSSIQLYYKTNMELLNPKVRQELLWVVIRFTPRSRTNRRQSMVRRQMFIIRLQPMDVLLKEQLKTYSVPWVRNEGGLYKRQPGHARCSSWR